MAFSEIRGRKAALETKTLCAPSKRKTLTAPDLRAPLWSDAECTQTVWAFDLASH